MKFGRVLLRVLISLSLILNGSGYAMAASHVAGDHAAPPAASAPTASELVAEAQHPCHDPATAAAPAESTQRSDAAQDGSATGAVDVSVDCCKNGACRCGCVHQTQVAVPGLLPGSALLASPPLRGQQSRHAEPAAPHPMRPPIA